MQEDPKNLTQVSVFQQSSIFENQSIIEDLQAYSFKELGPLIDYMFAYYYAMDFSTEWHLEMKVGSVQQRKQYYKDKNNQALVELKQQSRDSCVLFSDSQIYNQFPIHSNASYEQYKALILNLTNKFKVKKTEPVYFIELRDGKNIYQMSKDTWIRKQKDNINMRTQSIIVKQHFFRIQTFQETLISKNCNNILKQFAEQQSLNNRVCLRIKKSQQFMVSKHIQIVAEQIVTLQNKKEIIAFIKRDPNKIQSYGQLLHIKSAQNGKTLKNEIQLRLTEQGLKHIFQFEKQQFQKQLGLYLLFLRQCLIKINHQNQGTKAFQLLKLIKKQEKQLIDKKQEK